MRVLQFNIKYNHIRRQHEEREKLYSPGLISYVDNITEEVKGRIKIYPFTMQS